MDGNPVLEEHSPLDMATAVHIANGKPAHYDLLRYIPGTFRTNGFALFCAPDLVSCCTLLLSEVPVFSPTSGGGSLNPLLTSAHGRSK